jgi:FkbM family methyltransferase
MNIRTIAERIARGRVFKRSFKVNGESMPIYISPDAQLKYMKMGKNAFDSDLIQIAEKMLHKNAVVWDVGANVGVFTFAAAAVAREGVVVSIEADIWLAGLLRRTRRLEPYISSDIRIVPVAVSEACGVAGFNVATRGRASNSLDCVDPRSQQGGVREKNYVPTITLDTLALTMPKPDFIKIDVEGAEGLVVKGGLSVIRDVRPVIYIELGAGSEEIYKYFVDAGYVCKAFGGGDPVKDRLTNVFFVPKENEVMLSRVESL